MNNLKKSKMKILHVLASNKFSGAENVVCQIIKMFKDEYDMIYCSPTGPIESKLHEENIEYQPMKKFCKGELKKIIAKTKPDIIHAHDLKATIYCSMLGFKHKIISHIHGNKEGMNKLTIKSVLFALACRKVNKIIWVSKSCYESFKFKDRLSAKSVILSNILSVEELKNKVKNDKNNYGKFDIVFLGRFVHEKNPTRLIEIAQCVRLKKPNLKFAIVGDGILRPEVEAKIAELNLQKNCKLFGFVSSPAKIVSNSKLMLLTSVREGTPMCALEALSLGIPVVSTKTDGMTELIKNNKTGFLFDTNEEASLYILKLLKSPAYRKKMSAQAAKHAEKINNIEKYKNTIMKIYKG